jgi:hypothetical protein
MSRAFNLVNRTIGNMTKAAKNCVVADELCMKDSKGVVRALITLDPECSPMLQFCDSDGRPRLDLMHNGASGGTPLAFIFGFAGLRIPGYAAKRREPWALEYNAVGVGGANVWERPTALSLLRS